MNMWQRQVDPREILLVRHVDTHTYAAVGLLAATFFLFVLSGSWAYSSWTGLSWATLVRGHVWRLVTSLVWYGSPGQVELFQAFGAAISWLALGTLLDEWWGPWRTHVLALACGVVGNLAAMLASLLLCGDGMVGGPGPAALGLVTAAVVVFRGRFLMVPRLSTRAGLPMEHLKIGVVLVLGLSFLVDLLKGVCLARYAGYATASGVALLFVTDRWRWWQRSRASHGDGDIVPFPGRDRYRWN